jgi:hypothetical protein
MMLIKQLVRPPGALFVRVAFGLASAKTRAIGVGLFVGLLAFAALPESVEIDRVPHLRSSRTRIGEGGHFAK